MPRDLLRMADAAESCSLIDSVWVGDALFVNRRRIIEHMYVMRHLWTRDNEPFAGKFFQFSGVTLEPKPVDGTCPIWLPTNAARRSAGYSDVGGTALGLRRTGLHADGWMTHSVSTMKNPFDQLRRVIEEVLPAVNLGTVEPNAI